MTAKNDTHSCGLRAKVPHRVSLTAILPGPPGGTPPQSPRKGRHPAWAEPEQAAIRAVAEETVANSGHHQSRRLLSADNRHIL